MNPWILLIVAGLLETGWAVGLKYTDGFSRFWPSLWTIVALAGSMFLLAVALRQLPVGTAYPVWVGIGSLGAAIFGMAFLGESTGAARILFLVLLVVAIGGLKVTSSSANQLTPAESETESVLEE